MYFVPLAGRPFDVDDAVVSVWVAAEEQANRTRPCAITLSVGVGIEGRPSSMGRGEPDRVRTARP